MTPRHHTQKTTKPQTHTSPQKPEQSQTFLKTAECIFLTISDGGLPPDSTVFAIGRKKTQTMPVD